MAYVEFETKADIGRFCKENEAMINKIMDAFSEAGLSPERGQQILAWCLGSSLALTHRPADKSEVIGTLVTAWQVTTMEME